jgi:3-oxoacyl-[acyl-carrier-protein] synthase III
MTGFSFKNVCIESVGYSLPEEIWTSDRIESILEPLYTRLKLPTGRLELMTGIKERRFWPHPIIASQASTLAAQEVFKKSRFDKKDIDLLIHCAVSRDCLEPATAAFVHHALGLKPGALCFDISNACLGFLNAMVTAAHMIESKHIQRALIVAGENGKPLLEKTIDDLLNLPLDRDSIKPYFANLTIGAGAAAMILCHKDTLPNETAPMFLGGVGKTDSAASTLCSGNHSENGTLHMQTEAEALLQAGLNLAQSTWTDFLKFTSWNSDTPERIITHQVGRTHQRKLYESLNLNIQKDFSTFEILGNIGAASLPITLAKAIESEAILEDDSVALLGIGSGLSTLMLALQW